ncbi:related to NADH-dehydrogenase (ubiquinone) [Saccharomycodes ludwigii]|uniref:Related to NADH-dehydrogenase (Ubiquinone) n=1 Tax=Saccharomycodes ludwigii TaxID=36035 RepID=A0A376B8M8_9ASCO|nr:related to NADH-dehydrogenase (ubiquinone) [Saccharomycodes ludwigii]
MILKRNLLSSVVDASKTVSILSSSSILLRNSSASLSLSKPLQINQFHRFNTSHLRHFHTSKITFIEPKPSIPKEKPTSSLKTIGTITKFFVLSSGVMVSVLGISLVAFFLYDATTYKEDSSSASISVPTLALNPNRGGPENLPVLDSTLDALDSELKGELSLNKPKLVILGSGWASVGLLKTLKPGDYDVTVISPTNYFLFTPLLPCAATGTLEVKSLMASIRKIVNDLSGHYLEAKAEKIEFEDKLVKVTSAYDESAQFYVPYDKLVVAVGCTSNTHGVQGLEYCSRLKTANDAIDIRKKIKANLEKSCLPTTTDEERRRLLSFVVCGGGPTGVEFAAEVFDLLNEDLPKSYPKLLRQEVSVHIIQSRSNILNTYDERIAEYATKRFINENIDVQINSRVEKILEDRVIFKKKNDKDGSVTLEEIPFGLCLWSTGVAQNPLAKNVTDSLPDHQKNRRAIETDSYLRVLGAPDVYAIGDCSTVKTDLADHAVDFVRNFIIKKHLHGISSDQISENDIKHLSLTYDEICEMGKELMKKQPQTREHLITLKDSLPQYDSASCGKLNFDQITSLLKNVEKQVTSLPATAQRAHQQGKYLGKKFNKLAKKLSLVENPNVTSFRSENPLKTDLDLATVGTTTLIFTDEEVYKPFRYVHLGSLAYIGNSAVFDLPGYSFVGGLVAMYLWRSIYFAQTVSIRTRVLLFMDWLKRGFFGRDILSE